MFEIDIKSDVAKLSKKLDSLAGKQLPYGVSRGMTVLAFLVKKAEQDDMSSVLDRPTSFTLNSLGVLPASKSVWISEVFVKDIAAAYLEPYVLGGMSRGLGSRNVFFRPGDIELNKFGNLPRSKIKQLLARNDVFVGVIKTKSGEVINGIWQRPYLRGRDLSLGASVSARNAKRGRGNAPRGSNTTGSLKLLIRFEDPHPVRQRLGWFSVADRVVKSNFGKTMGQSIAVAIATASK